MSLTLAENSRVLLLLTSYTHFSKHSYFTLTTEKKNLKWRNCKPKTKGVKDDVEYEGNHDQES